MERVVIALFIGLLASVDGQSNCEDLKSCGDCMSNAECLWCLDDIASVTTFPKCFSKYQEQQCQRPENPQSETIVLQQAPLNPDADEDIVQISPQRVRVNLRPLDPNGHTLRFNIAMSRQYPVDLYFLLDLSRSMETSRATVAQKGGDIMAGIRSLTQNLKTGIGSFIEKNLPPFTSVISSFNCPEGGTVCGPTYSYHHKTRLSELEPEEFEREVMEAPLAGNVDEAEASLDALMQVMTCWDRVGWRDNSRKIILIATDRDYHYAMDGKLLGILERNDGTCHLNGTTGTAGFYTHEAMLDYPSISHINYVAQQSSFIVIFAVVPRYKGIWQALSDQLDGSSVEILEDDSANIVQLITEKYEEITSSIKVKVENPSKDIFVNLKSRCSGGQELETDSCNDVELGTPVEFKAEISARKCLDEPQILTLSPVGLNQTLTVEVHTICDCDCEQPGNEGFIPQAQECNSQGDNQCGVCSCLPGYSGQACECDTSSFSSNPDDPKAVCRDPESEELICNGLGSCQCGACLCHDPKKNYGQYCQCDDTTCRRDSKGRLCSGKGDCVCDECQCYEGWSGLDCSCDERENQCLSPYNGQGCSGKGDCNCNACQCASEDGRLFSGQFCEKYPGEINPCLILKDCVECMAFGTGPKEGDICISECNFQYMEVSRENLTLALQEEVPCEFQNSQGCTYQFISDRLSNDEIAIYLLLIDGQKEECTEVNALAISLSLFGAILLAGLIALLIWKCCIVVSDRRMLAAFEKEAEATRYATNQNPNDIYKSPITEYKNPMYGKAIN